MTILSLRRTTSASALAFALLSALPANPASAQDAPLTTPGVAGSSLATPASPAGGEPSAADSAASDATAAGGEIVVTGSRLGRSGYDAPTPVNVIGQERLKALGISNVGDALNQIPSFRAITTPAANSFRVSTNIGARNLDLRGLGPTRTLTLVDGRRFVGSSDNGTVDLNAIPSILVKRSEVVTGGASAAYGANAVAGVVNLILDTKLKGFKADVNYGISQRGDARSFYAGAADGMDFAGGRGHFVVGLEYAREGGVGACEQRAWCSKYTNYIPNPGYIPANAATGAAGSSTNGLPATLVLNNVMSAINGNGILAGIVVPLAPTAASANPTRALGQQVLNIGTATELPASLRGRQFDTAGNLIPYTFGNYLSGLLEQIRDPSQPYNLAVGQLPLVTPNKHASGLAHADFDVSDAITLSAEFLYAHNEGGPAQSAASSETPAALGFDNPYLSAATRAALIAAISPLVPAGGSTATNRPKIQVNVSNYDLGPGNIGTSKLDTYRGVLALKGKLSDSWDWDASYSYGRVHSRVDNLSNGLKTRTEAFDATRTGQAAIVAPNGVVLASATPSLAASGIADGTIVCRSTLANPTNGCIPYSFFGDSSLSPAAAAKYFQSEWQTRTFQQHSGMANLRGTPFATWAGDIKVAVGGEWRRDSAVGDTDALTKAPFLAGAASTAGFTSPQAVPLTSATRIDANGIKVANLDVPVKAVVTTVVEGYLEASVPLLKDSALGRALDIDGAIRRSHYDPFGNATTWKVGGVYTPISDITFRVTKSRDVRAPTAAEANPLATAAPFALPDLFVNTTHNVQVVSGGNPNLQLEKGDTFTAGVVLKPSFLRRFNMSVDYYNIKVKGAIDSLSASAISTACATQGLLCDLITFAGTPRASQITQVQSTFQNLSRLHAEGFELVMDYSFPALGGTIATSVNGNYVVDLSTLGATGLVTQLDGQTGNVGTVANITGVPRWKADGVITYARDTWSVTAHGRYVPRSILDPTKIGPEDDGYSVNLPNSISTNRVDSRFYLDLTGTIKIADTRRNGSVEMFVAVSNVFDTPEPPQLRTFGNALQYDPIQRFFRVGVRTNF